MPARVLMQDFTGVPAIVDLAAMRDAVVGLGGERGSGRAHDPGRPGHRPLDRRRRRRGRGRVRPERRARVRTQRGALHVPAVGAGRVPHAARVPAEPGDLPSGEPGVPRPGRVPRRHRPRLSRHARRHGLAHADGERARRARLGRRRHRGRSRDARAAAVVAPARGRRHRTARRPARRVRPPPTSC